VRSSGSRPEKAETEQLEIGPAAMSPSPARTSLGAEPVAAAAWLSSPRPPPPGRGKSSPEGHSSGVRSAEIGRKFVGAFTQTGAPKTEGEALQILAAIVPLFAHHAGPSTQPKTSARRRW
jgi:hypothetical protein